MSEFLPILPEVFLALTLAFVVIGEITYHGEQVRLVTATALMGLAAAFIQTLITYQYGPIQIFHQTFSVDGLSLFFKLFFITLATLAVIAANHSREVPISKRSEYSALVIASALAMSTAASASDLLLAFLSLQLVNILAYFLAAFGKRSNLSIEAAIKYMIFSAVAGALMLYALALLFGATHTLNVYEMHKALVAAPLSHETMVVVVTLLLLSFAFQLGAFPMYFWAPDVLQGAPTPASAFLSIGGRAAGLAVALRFMIVAFAQPGVRSGQWQALGSFDWTRMVAVISGLSMLIGAFLALRQQGAKRLVAYLIIAETGYLLLGFLVLDQVGLAAILYTLATDLFSLMGIYYVLAFLIERLQSDRLADLQGMMGRAVLECICLVVFLLCLIGVPPFPGFIGKFALIGVAVRHQKFVLAAIAIFSVALSTIAIARLAYGLVGDIRRTVSLPLAPSPRRQAFLVALVVPLVLAGLFAEQVLTWAGKSVGFILW